MTKKVAICSIITGNFLAFARTLVQSVKENNPDYDFYLCIIDSTESIRAEVDTELIQLIELSELISSDQYATMDKTYGMREFIFSLKPFMLDYVLSLDYEKVMYFDTDILVLDSLAEIDEYLDDFNIVITPHLLDPVPIDGCIPDEITILRAGTYNLGFIGIRESVETRRFLSWWKERLVSFCMEIPAQGLFVDQKWIDLVPALFDNVLILKNPGFNVGFWNLHSRKVHEENGRYFVGEKKTPLVFFHFSGLKLDDGIHYNAYQNRINYHDEPALKKLILGYVELINTNGHRQYKNLPSTTVSITSDNKEKDLSVTSSDKNSFLYNPYRELERLQKKEVRVMRAMGHPIIRFVVNILKYTTGDKSFGKIDE